MIIDRILYKGDKFKYGKKYYNHVISMVEKYLEPLLLYHARKSLYYVLIGKYKVFAKKHTWNHLKAICMEIKPNRDYSKWRNNDGDLTAYNSPIIELAPSQGIFFVFFGQEVIIIQGDRSVHLSVYKGEYKTFISHIIAKSEDLKVNHRGNITKEYEDTVHNSGMFTLKELMDLFNTNITTDKIDALSFKSYPW